MPQFAHCEMGTLGAAPSELSIIKWNRAGGLGTMPEALAIMVIVAFHFLP